MPSESKSDYIGTSEIGCTTLDHNEKASVSSTALVDNYISKKFIPAPTRVDSVNVICNAVQRFRAALRWKYHFADNESTPEEASTEKDQEDDAGILSTNIRLRNLKAPIGPSKLENFCQSLTRDLLHNLRQEPKLNKDQKLISNFLFDLKTDKSKIIALTDKTNCFSIYQQILMPIYSRKK